MYRKEKIINKGKYKKTEEENKREMKEKKME